MSMMKEFKEFAMKGNLIDLAVGFVMGAAFTKLTTAFIDGMVMPVVGLIQGKDLSEWKFILKPESVGEKGKKVAEVAIKYGDFLSICVQFVIIAFVMFMVVKTINKMKKKEAEIPVPPPAPTATEILLTEIRDSLKK